MNRPLCDTDLARLGLEPGHVVPLILDPGDVALWSLYTIHGFGPNNSALDRRTYINGYVRAGSCDRGEWAFRQDNPCRLGAPALIHYEDVYSRPEPHYVDE